MPLTPADISAKQFKSAFRGYNEDEVDAFLDQVEAELGRLLAQLAATPSVAQTSSTADATPGTETTPDTGAVTPVQTDPEQAALRTLLIAQRTADEVVAEAREEAAAMLEQARVQLATSEQEARQRQSAAIMELDQRRTALEAHIEALRAFEREYRTRLKAYLEAQLHDLDSRAAPAPETSAASPFTPAPSAAADVPAGLPSTAASPDRSDVDPDAEPR